MSDLYNLSVKDIQLNDIDLSSFQGKTLLIVNVASKCGFTPQYKDLQNLFDKYKEQGLEVLGFPCNQFGGQEPGTNEEVQSFCDLTFNVSFKMFDKIEVNGENASPFLYLNQIAHQIERLMLRSLWQPSWGFEQEEHRRLYKA